MNKQVTLILKGLIFALQTVETQGMCVGNLKKYRAETEMQTIEEGNLA